MTKTELLVELSKVEGDIQSCLKLYKNQSSNNSTLHILDRIERVLLALVEKLPEDKV